MRDVYVTVGAEDRAEPICDFCGATEPAWVYPAEEFTVAVMMFAPDGQDASIDHTFNELWAACSPCGVLIEDGDRDGLLARAASLREPGSGSPTRDALLSAVHTGFLKRRTGPRQPYTAPSTASTREE